MSIWRDEMKIETKYNIGDKVWFFENWFDKSSKIKSSIIRGIWTNQNEDEESICISYNIERFGGSRNEDSLFATQKEAQIEQKLYLEKIAKNKKQDLIQAIAQRKKRIKLLTHEQEKQEKELFYLNKKEIKNKN